MVSTSFLRSISGPASADRLRPLSILPLALPSVDPAAGSSYDPHVSRRLCLVLSAIPQKGGKYGGSWGPAVLAAPRPVLEWSMVVKLEGLKKVRLVVASDSNEWGPTQICPGSRPRREWVSPAVPLHFHTLLSSVLPPFSGLLNAVLSHYEIHALHLDPRSLVLISAFAFLCEAFVGVTPSVALLRHFFSLEMISEVRCFACASLRTIDATAPGVLYTELLPKAEGFLRQWVQVEAAEAGALFQPPPTPATPNQGWEREELGKPRLAPVLIRLEKLRRAGVSMAMVMCEFICRWIAPLQRHSHPMWAYTRPSDSMRTQVVPFSPDFLRELLRQLTSDNPDELPPKGVPL
ncbi:hypothetical protein D1007_27244 [Hordeum vulgare]|nr:hypothetical protein D1007_27244 [Hordeum vulgare]